MILRNLAESDYHFDAAVVSNWTFYQLRMYMCDKKLLDSKVFFATADEALAYNAAAKERNKPKLKTFEFQKE